MTVRAFGALVWSSKFECQAFEGQTMADCSLRRRLGTV